MKRTFRILMQKSFPFFPVSVCSPFRSSFRSFWRPEKISGTMVLWSAIFSPLLIVMIAVIDSGK